MNLDNMQKETTVPLKEDDESSTDDFDLDQEKTAVSSDNDFIKKETKQVNCLRILFVLVLLLVGAAVSTVIYFITSDSDEEQTESYYAASAETVLNTFEDIVGVKITTITSLTSSITTYAMENNKTWPFVTMASYPTRGAIARSLTGALVIGTNPIVLESIRSEWEEYIVGNESSWMQDSYNYQADLYPNFNSALEFRDPSTSFNVNRSSYPILLSHFSPEVDSGPGPYLVVHQTSPFIPGFTNVNQRSSEIGSEAIMAMDSKSVVIGKPIIAEKGNQFFESIMSISVNNTQTYVGDPVSNVFVPYFDSLNQDRNVVGFMSIFMRWGFYFENILPQNHDKVVAVLENTCTGSNTYLISGSNVTYMGVGDLHDRSYNYLQKRTTYKNQEVIPDGTKTGLPLNQDSCAFVMNTYPSDVPKSNTPIIATCVVATVFLFTIFLFCFYDHLVEKRNSIVLDRANQTTAIVSSLFPKSIAERLLQHEVQSTKNKKAAFRIQSGSNKLKSFLNNGDSDIGLEPIADLFLDTTVMFADIAGFTAWSSTREPVQVFVLLQTLYQGFDEIAQRRKVFKVETIGDSYVAVTGLPDKQQHHALIMARFCGDCLEKTYEIFHELERRLGPDTTELGMRFGMHSGPVTGGVLRGDKARFQLFGDTVNTAARMESTGFRNRIHISEDSANLISSFGKTHWVKLREDKVQAKGKGIMNTYWLNPTARRANSVISSAEHGRTTITYRDLVSTNARHERLVNWVCELILEPLKKIIALRNHRAGMEPNGEAIYHQQVGDIPIDEIAEVIVLPDFNARIAAERANYKNIELREEIMEQLKSYVTAIAATYRDNPFHNFEHACHVTMSVSKLMNRIVAPDIETNDISSDGKNGIESQLHDHTYGITSDPLALLAIIFSALIHDTDHRGVSNMQLCKEDPMLGEIYKAKSVAEQNSLDIAWRILMDDQYTKLRRCLFNNQSDMDHFRQVMVNVVLATDIFDKELNDLRKNRWNKAFHDDSTSKTDLISLRATIVIEHIIQASDVSHTMQHWHVYQKWNRRLFSEMRRAFNEGRMGADPAGFWYQGEIGFFDNYIIPLAKKLKECRVFGVSSDEYLNYAMQNRAEWAERGQEIVAELIVEYPLFQDDEDDVLLGKKESTIDSKGLLSKKESIIEIKGPPLFSVDVGDEKNSINVPLPSVDTKDKRDDHEMADKSERSESNYSL